MCSSQICFPLNECTLKMMGIHELLIKGLTPSHSLITISGIYGVVVTSQNGGIKDQDIALRGSRIREYYIHVFTSYGVRKKVKEIL